MPINTNTRAAINATDSNAGLKPDAYYDKILLEMLRQTNFMHRKFAKKKSLPKNFGDTVNFRRFEKLAVNVTPLTEGVSPDGKLASAESITATIAQYGDVMYFTDRVDNEQLDDVVTEYTVELGYQAAESLDQVAREAIIGEASVFYAGTGNAGVNDLASTDIPTIDDFRKIVLSMKLNHIKPERSTGKYVALVSPAVMFDLLDDATLEKYMQYGMTNSPMKDNMVADIYDLRFMEVLNAKAVANTVPVDVHHSLVIGNEAFGDVELAGEGNVKIIKKGLGSGGTADPLDQRQSVGWKVNGYTCKVLTPLAVYDYMSVPTQG